MNTSSEHSVSQVNVEHWTSRVLRLGVWISAGCMICGLVLAALFPSSMLVFASSPSLQELLARCLSGTVDPSLCMYAGLVVLMCTPIVRVVTALIGFGVERDWRFVLVSAVVFLMLMGEIVYSIFLKG